jgi:hypothetical protein
VDWNRWPVAEYLAENYRQLHPADAAVIDHHSAFYRRFAPGSLARSLEFGAGPNLYPLMLAAAASRSIHAVEPSAASLAYLRRQLAEGADPSWLPFYERCRSRNPDLPASLARALSRVTVVPGSALDLPAGGYPVASMNFVAESVTERADEFTGFCRAFACSVRPGGGLVAAFMENMGRYRIGGGPHWPGYPVDVAAVRAAFAPLTDDLDVDRIDADPTLPDYGYTGMVVLTARRSAS